MSREEAAALGRALALWRRDPQAALTCPRCGAGGLSVGDHSARPAAEWFVLACPSCGLTHTIQIPLGSSSSLG